MLYNLYFTLDKIYEDKKPVLSLNLIATDDQGDIILDQLKITKEDIDYLYQENK